jgi:hypothetical protein
MDFFSTEWMKGEKYGITIGEAVRNGKTLDEAVRMAYREYGLISQWQLFFGINSPFLTAMSGVVGSLCRSKREVYLQNLKPALIAAAREMKGYKLGA